MVVVNADSEPAGLGVKAGSEVLEVDGLPVEDKIAQLRLRLHACSSERAFQREARRYLLAGERDTRVNVKLRLPDSRANLFAPGWRQRSAPQPCAFDLKQGRFVQFGHHPSGMGFDQAPEALQSSLIIGCGNQKNYIISV